MKEQDDDSAEGDVPETVPPLNDQASEEVLDEGALKESEGGPTGEPPVNIEEELERARDQVLRHQAEVQNVKRRAEQDVEKARKYALERFCNELLPIVDNLERALSSAPPDQEDKSAIVEGVELTLKMFVDSLAKFNIEQVDPEGEPFDPKLHQAMSIVENQEVEPNTVISVMQRGYVLNGRLVRPAMVLVSKAPE